MLAAILTVALLVAIFALHRQTAPSQSKVIALTKRRIEAARLTGASPDTVIRFLRRYGIDHGGYHVRPEPMSGREPRTVQGIIRGLEPEAHELIEGPYELNLRLRFYFDKQDRMTHYRLELTSTGP